MVSGVSGYPIGAILAGGVACLVAATLTASALVRAGFPLPPADRRIGCIDGLRGYLGLSVLINHFVIWMQASHITGRWGESGVMFFQQLGTGGVALFFMTTGLVFYPRVLAGFRAVSWPAILVTRVFRILPLVIVSVAAMTLIVALRTGHGLDAAYPRAALTWISTTGEPPLLGYPDSGRLNAHVLWSLGIEWLFYLLVLPLCALAMDRIRGRAPAWTIPLALGLVSVVARIAQVPVTLPVFLPLFASGMLAFELSRDDGIARRLRTRGAACLAIAALLAGMILFSRPYMFALPLFAFFFLCVACGNDLFGALATRGALALGECSYGIYLLHGIVLGLVFVDAAGVTARIPLAWLPALLPVVGVVVVLVTPVTYLLVERPAIRLGRVLARRWTGRAPPPLGPVLEIAP